MRNSRLILFVVALTVTALALSGCESGWERASRMRNAASDWNGWIAFYLMAAGACVIWGLGAALTIPFAGTGVKRETEALNAKRQAMADDLAAAAAERAKRAAELEAAKVGMPYFERLANDLESDERS